MTKGERIKHLREGMGMPQVTLADKICVSKQTLYKYENNIITNIPSDKIEALADALNTTPAYIMGWEEPEQYYTNSEAAELAQNIFEHPELRILMDAARGCSSESIMALIPLIQKLKETNPNA